MKSKQLKRVLLLLCLSLAIVLALAACSSPEEPSTPDNPVDRCQHEWQAVNKTYGEYCDEEGIIEYACNLCKETKTEPIPAKGHTEVTVKGTASTCTVDGVSDSSYCEVCGKTLKEAEFIPAPGHTIVKDEAVAPTCTETGLTEGAHCSTCDTVTIEQYIVYSKGHTDVLDRGYDATCTKDGLTDGYHCGVCGTVTDEQRVISAYGHNEQTLEAVEVGCATDGLTEGSYCYTCGETLVEQTVVPAEGHKYIVVEAKEATCQSDGNTAGRKCETCGIVFEASTVIKSEGHKFDGDSCQWCDLTATAGLIYELSSDSTYYIVKGIAAGSTETDIVIPDSYEGKRVKLIAEGAFNGNSTIKTVHVAGGVMRIQPFAFDSCTSLVSVTLAKSVEYVENYAFDNCPSLVEVRVEDYTQTSAWSEYWIDAEATNEEKAALLASDMKDGKTPYEIYLEAMEYIAKGIDRLTTEFTNASKVYDMQGNQLATQSERYYSENCGKDVYIEMGTQKIWYKDEVMYVYDSAQAANYRYLKMAACYDYIRETANTIQNSFPAVSEELFLDAEFVMNADGTYTLTLVMVEEEMEDMIGSILGPDYEQMFKDGTLAFESCVYKYDIDANGYITHTYSDFWMLISQPDGQGGTIQLRTHLDGDMVYGEINTLASIKSVPSVNFIDVTKSNCSHYEGYHVTVPGYDATCTEQGLSDGVYCKNCYQSITPSAAISAKGHTTEQGICDDCGIFIGSVTDFEVKYNDDGKTAVLVGAGTVDEQYITIPDSIYGIKIVEIADGAFEGMEYIKRVYIPDSVKIIGDRAFSGCLRLQSVNIGSEHELTKIGEEAFAGCEYLEEIFIPATVTEIGDGAFARCNSLVINAEADSAPVGWSSSFKPESTVVNYSYTPSTAGLEYSNQGGYFVITGYTGKSTDIYIRADYKGLPVKAIGSSAFYGMNITSVVICDGIEEIGGSAFEDCAKLENVTLPSSLTTISSGAFSGCTKLESITLPSSLTKVEYYAFKDCRSLKAVEIGSSVTWLESLIFDGCTSLSEIKYDVVSNAYNSDKIFGNVGSASCPVSVVIGANVKELPNFIFQDSYYITSVTFESGSSLEKIGNWAFYGCSGITSMEIPSCVTYVGGLAFEGLPADAYTVEDGLRYIPSANNDYFLLIGRQGSDKMMTINGKTEMIAASAFADDTNLLSVTLGEDLRIICNSAFYGCTSLMEVINKSSLELVLGDMGNGYVAYYAKAISTGESALYIADGYYAVYNAEGDYYTLVATDNGTKFPDNINGKNYVIGEYLFYDNDGISKLVIPEGVIGIGHNAFWDCDYISEIVLPSTMKTVGMGAFGSCDSLSSVTLNDGLETIGCRAFYNLQNLKTINIPDSVKVIEAEAFYGMWKLETVTIGSGVETIGARAFTSECLKTVTIASGDTPLTIESGAFGGFNGYNPLESITLPERIVELEYGAIGADPYKIKGTYYEGITYLGCEENPYLFAFSTTRTGITSATIHEDTVFMNYGLLSDYGIAQSLTEINFNAREIKDMLIESYNGEITGPMLGYNYNLTGSVTLNIGAEVTRIPYQLLHTNNNVTAIVFADNCKLEYIGDYAFNKAKITELVLPESITHLGVGVFKGCKQLTTVTLPSSVTEIPKELFCDCQLLTTVNFAPGTTSIGEYAFSGCSSLTDFKLPDTIEAIGMYAFRYCPLGTVIIPESMTVISEYAFASSYITGVVMHDGVTEIGSYAFFNAEKLEWVVIPKAVTFGTQSFYGCNYFRVWGGTVYYMGTASEWSSLNKNEYLYGEYITNRYVKVYYYTEENTAGGWYYDEATGLPTLWS